MRNCWLAAIAGLQGNAPSNIPEGPAGAEGAGGTCRRPPAHTAAGASDARNPWDHSNT